MFELRRYLLQNDDSCLSKKLRSEFRVVENVQQRVGRKERRTRVKQTKEKKLDLP